MRAPAGRSWPVAVATLVLAQFASAFPMRILPTLGPLITAEVGVPRVAVGYFASVAMVGFIVSSILAAPLVMHFGTLRTLKAVLLVGGVSVIIAGIPMIWTLIVASILAGLCDGPTSVAGNRALQRCVPMSRRNLAFSLKMTGGPLGGMTAGLLLPIAAVNGEWRYSLVLAGLVVTLAVFALQLLQNPFEDERGDVVGFSLGDLFSPQGLAESVRESLSDNGLRRLILIGAVLSFMQGCWLTFLVTFAVVELGHSLSSAGFLFAVSQLTGVSGRIVLGQFGDRFGATHAMRLICVASAIAWLALAVSRQDWPYLALVGLSAFGGATITGWAGLQHGEIARIASAARMTTVSGSAVMFSGLGFLASGALFPLAIGLFGSYRMAFACLSFICGLLLFSVTLVGEGRESVG